METVTFKMQPLFFLYSFLLSVGWCITVVAELLTDDAWWKITACYYGHHADVMYNWNYYWVRYSSTGSAKEYCKGHALPGIYTKRFLTFPSLKLFILHLLTPVNYEGWLTRKWVHENAVLLLDELKGLTPEKNRFLWLPNHWYSHKSCK